MRALLIVFVLTGCSVFRDARDELRKDVTVIKSEFARLYSKEKLQ